MSDCDVCNNFALLQKATCDEKAYRWNVLKTLCYIIELLSVEEAEVAPATVVLEQVVKSYTQLEAGYASYATIGLIDTTKKLNYIRVINNTDADLEFSFDGGATTAFMVMAGNTYDRTFNLTLAATTSIQMQKVSGQTAGFGNVFIEGDYAL